MGAVKGKPPLVEKNPQPLGVESPFYEISEKAKEKKERQVS
jgi:hypothetical protein